MSAPSPQTVVPVDFSSNSITTIESTQVMSEQPLNPTSGYLQVKDAHESDGIELAPSATQVGQYEKIQSESPESTEDDAGDSDQIQAIIDRHIELSRPHDIHIEYHDLTFSVKADAEHRISSVSSILQSLLLFWQPRPKKRIDILASVTGRIQPRKMTLLLGPPGSGKSVLLKAIAGRLRASPGYSAFSGEVFYDGDNLNSGKFFVPKICDYIEQGDTHEPVLTVEETFAFSWLTTTGGHSAYATAKDDASAAILNEADASFSTVKNIIAGLGLTGCKDTWIGNARIRGISGGQKRRVTIGELMACPRPIKLMDCITNGLDTATAYDIIKSLRAMTMSLGHTNVTALLQPPPDVYNLFDEIILLCEGHVIFHGPRAHVTAYFENLGYFCPPHVDEADFLQELPTPDGRRFVLKPVIAHNALSFAQAWKQSALYKSMIADLTYSDIEDARRREKANTKTWYVDNLEKFAASFWFFFKLLFVRSIRVMMRDSAFATARIGQCVIMGAIGGSLFSNIGVTEVNTMNGFLFNTTLFSALGSFAILPIVFDQKAVFYKQKASLFFSTSAFTLAQSAAMLPLQIVESIVYTLIVYWSAGLASDYNGSRFFTFLAISVIFAMCVGQIYRLIASAVADMRAAIPASGVVLMIMILFSGFIQPKSVIPPGWLWFYWINPVAWALKAVTINEFTAPKYNFLTCSDAACTSEERFGDHVLLSYGNPTNQQYVWYAFAILVGQFAALLFLTYLASEFMYTEPIPPPPVRDSYEEAVLACTPAGGEAVTPDDQDLEDGAPRSTRSNTQHQQLPYDSVAFAFKDIQYSVTLPNGEDIQLLNGVNGYFEPGTMTALMGSSGAGKTTLLDVLAGRKNTGVVQGDIYLNGSPKVDAYFRKIMAYVEQFDTLSPCATPREAVAFSAELRLAPTITSEQKREWVNAVLEMMELGSIENQVIGLKDGSGMSFEQRKRVSIAIELVSNPSILFLDEPTTGLDSLAAQVLIKHIRKIALSGRSVVCTIHQPSAAIFHAFDSLLLLQKGGKTVYFGKLGKQGQSLIDYMEAVPGVARMPQHVNPATWMLEVIGAGVMQRAAAASTGTVDFHMQYLTSSLCTANADNLDVLCRPLPGSRRLEDVDLVDTGGYNASYGTQFSLLMRRMALTYWRTPAYSLGRNVTNLFIALIFGSAYPKQKYDDDVGVMSRSAVIYITIMFCGVMSMLSAIPVHCTERSVFYCEQQSRMYSKFLFALTQTLIEIPYTLVASLIYTAPFFFIVGFDNVGVVGEKFLYYWLFAFLVQASLLYMGVFYVSLTPDEASAQVLGGLTASLVSLFCGFLIGEQSFPKFWLFMYYLSPLHYGLEGLIATQFKGDDTTITDLNGDTMTAESYIKIAFPKWGFDNVGYDVMALCLFIGVAVIGNYLCLAYLRNEKR